MAELFITTAMRTSDTTRNERFVESRSVTTFTEALFRALKPVHTMRQIRFNFVFIYGVDIQIHFLSLTFLRHNVVQSYPVTARNAFLEEIATTE
jgi:hypothetical protein